MCCKHEVQCILLKTLGWSQKNMLYFLLIPIRNIVYHNVYCSSGSVIRSLKDYFFLKQSLPSYAKQNSVHQLWLWDLMLMQWVITRHQLLTVQVRYILFFLFVMQTMYCCSDIDYIFICFIKV